MSPSQMRPGLEPRQSSQMRPGLEPRQSWVYIPSKTALMDSVSLSAPIFYVNNHVHRVPFSDIGRKKEVAKSKE